MFQLVVAKCPSEAHALTNALYVHPSHFPKSGHFTVNTHFYYAVKSDSSVPAGQIGTSTIMRAYMGLALGERITVQPFDPVSVTPNCYLDVVTVGVGMLKKNRNPVEFDAEKMSGIFRTMFEGQVLSVGQPVVMESAGMFFRLTVYDLKTVNLEALGANMQRAIANPASSTVSDQRWGVVVAHSGVLFTTSHEDSDGLVNIANQAAVAGLMTSHPIIQPNFKLEDMGIGGLANEFAVIFRRAFASRVFPDAVKRLGIQHVKGVLLHGPPGTGKTLIARQIGKMLNAREPKIVNGPEILNKYVGQSEENIRALFKDAEVEYKSKGDSSQLHIIIFDELDAICRQRGARGDSTGVGDQVVNQLLSKMDGVEQLNNILVIGMTNRLDLIDEALLRPGRMEVHLEISLPDENGRLEIFKIHTSMMRANKSLSPDVDIPELARLAKNYSGAEITGVVKSAGSFALNRHVHVAADGTVEGELGPADLIVNRDDFIKAMQDVKAAFGKSETELESCLPMGIIHFSGNIQRIVSDAQLDISQIRSDPTPSPLASLLLHGPAGSGKTALAAHLALESGYPFVKLLSYDAMIGLNEPQRVAHIHRIFTDAYKSPLSLIIVDEIERLLDYVSIGPRFLNSTLQCLIVLLKKPPPPGHRLLIISTSSEYALLKEMGMEYCFTSELLVPAVRGFDELRVVVQSVAGDQAEHLASALHGSHIASANITIPIKLALGMIKKALQDSQNCGDVFLQSVAPYVL